MKKISFNFVPASRVFLNFNTHRKRNGTKLFRQLSCHVGHFRTGQLQQAGQNLARLVGRINKAREGGSKMFSDLGITRKNKKKKRKKERKNENI